VVEANDYSRPEGLYKFQTTYGERKMTRTMILIGLLMVPRPAQAQTFEFGPDGLHVRPYGRGVDCRELRAACLHKEELGEAGAGNCRRYRELCTGGERVDCRELRAACMHKEELGEAGAGNCRRYRELCTGGERGYHRQENEVQ
jgi:hypothetical protein